VRRTLWRDCRVKELDLCDVLPLTSSPPPTLWKCTQQSAFGRQLVKWRGNWDRRSDRQQISGLEASFAPTRAAAQGVQLLLAAVDLELAAGETGDHGAQLAPRASSHHLSLRHNSSLSLSSLCVLSLLLALSLSSLHLRHAPGLAYPPGTILVPAANPEWDSGTLEEEEDSEGAPELPESMKVPKVGPLAKYVFYNGGHGESLASLQKRLLVTGPFVINNVRFALIPSKAGGLWFCITWSPKPAEWCKWAGTGGTLLEAWLHVRAVRKLPTVYAGKLPTSEGEVRSGRVKRARTAEPTSKVVIAHHDHLVKENGSMITIKAIDAQLIAEEADDEWSRVKVGNWTFIRFREDGGFKYFVSVRNDREGVGESSGLGKSLVAGYRDADV
jgi:hypothetical protein